MFPYLFLKVVAEGGLRDESVILMFAGIVQPKLEFVDALTAVSTHFLHLSLWRNRGFIGSGFFRK